MIITERDDLLRAYFSAKFDEFVSVPSEKLKAYKFTHVAVIQGVVLGAGTSDLSIQHSSRILRIDATAAKITKAIRHIPYQLGP